MTPACRIVPLEARESRKQRLRLTIKGSGKQHFGAPTEQGHEGRGMGSMATANRWKWGGMGEQAILAWGQAQDTPGRVPCSSSSRITGCVESACERMVQRGLSGAEHASRRRAAVVGVMVMVLRGLLLTGAYGELVAAAAQLQEGPILAEQEMNLSAS